MGSVEFAGTDRYEVRRRLGAGGMGVVYQAFDRERGTLVALKTLREHSPASLYRFKQEFRGLADISHPNLATLHELEQIGDRWFFTMELVEGTDFVSYVRRAPDPGLESAETQAVADMEPQPSALGSGSHLVHYSAPADTARLRGALRQLAEGVHAIHLAGKLHRDIKPSNVLVTPTGRVVVLDFGLIMELIGPGAEPEEDLMVGTADYMAPEQAQAMTVPLSPASDWYAVGCVLYKALTGQKPFRGSAIEVICAKQDSDPPPPGELVPELPEDLSELCVDLLDRAAEQRPTGADVLRRLGVRMSPIRHSTPLPADTFVGRRSQLDTLSDAFDSVTAEPIVALVHGRSGAGKSALLRRFCDQLRHRHDATVLNGRCYERESVPYKGLDSLIDALCRHLLGLPRSEAEALLPEDTAAMSRLFPVLRRVEAVAASRLDRLGTDPGEDPHEHRRRGVAGLRALLSNLAGRGPLVLSIDDFQWGDIDSASLLVDLVTAAGAPPVLLVVTYRAEEVDRSPAVRTLLDATSSATFGPRVCDVSVDALSEDEARALAMVRLGRDDEAGRAAADAIVAEAGGNAFFVDELARHRSAGGEQSETSLEQVVRGRLELLSRPTRRVLDVVAVAARPMRQDIAFDAAEVGDGRLALAELRGAHLVRTTGVRGSDQIEPYHDRIREIAVALLSADSLQRQHRALATRLASSEHADPEALAFHFGEAGDPARCAEYAAIAADKASRALAFERAARYYAMSLLQAPDQPSAHELRVKRGDALANAGIGAQAAGCYLEAAGECDGSESLELRRRAAEQLLRAGHVDEGLRALRSVLGDVGMALATTRRRALASLVMRRAAARLRGLRYRERPESQIVPERLSRIDICWSVSVGLGLTDPIRGSDFQTRHLLLALAAGEPYRVSRALAMEGAYSAIAGERSWSRTRALIDTAGEIADRIDSGHARGLVAFAGGLAAYQRGRWRDGFEGFEECARILRAEAKGADFEIASALRFGVDALCELGELSQMRARVPAQLRDAERRGDLYGATDMRTGLPNMVWLIDDSPDTARAECQQGRERWSKLDFYLQHYYEVYAQTHIDLYVGDADSALDRVDRMWPDMQRSLLLKIQAVRVQALFLRGRCQLAAGRVRDAGATARRLEREPTPGAPGLATVLRAGARAKSSDRAGAIAGYERAARVFDAAQMNLMSACCRRYVSGDEQYFRAQGVVRPDRITRLWLGLD